MTTTPAPEADYQSEVVTRDQIERSLDRVLSRLRGTPSETPHTAS